MTLKERLQNKSFTPSVKEIIDTGRGIYERNVLKALMARIGLYPVMSYVELSSKQVARVIRQNAQLPVSPTVRVEYDENGRKLATPSIIDLSQSQFVHIIGPAKRDLAPAHTSQFASVKKKSVASKFEISKDVISFVLLGLVLLILLYVVVKI